MSTSGIDTRNLFKGVPNFFRFRNFSEFRPTHNKNVFVVKDPETLKFKDEGQESQPIPQTQIFQLQETLLSNPKLSGVFCFLEKEGKVEFVLRGDAARLLRFECLFVEIFFGNVPKIMTYDGLAAHFAAAILDQKIEAQISEQWPHCFITEFPERAKPFWNIKRIGGGATGAFFAQVDLLVRGEKVISSAEFSCNPTEMLEAFGRMNGGEFKKAVLEKVGDMFMTRLESFLSQKFETHCGGCVDIRKMAEALKKAG